MNVIKSTWGGTAAENDSKRESQVLVLESDKNKRGSLYSFFDASLRGRMAGKSGLVSKIRIS
jgi:hypothetical protein